MFRVIGHPLALTIVAACAIAVAMFTWLAPHSQIQLAARLHAEANAASVEEAVGCIEQLAKLGEPAIAHLVALHCDAREPVHNAAREALQRIVDEVLASPSPTRESCLADLSHELAKRDLPADLAGQLFVKETALQLLSLPEESNAVSTNSSRLAMLADCSVLLERTLKLRRESDEERQSQATTATEATISDEPGVPVPYVVQQVEPAPESSETKSEITNDEAVVVAPRRLQPDLPRRIRQTEIATPDAQEAPTLDPVAIHQLTSRSLMKKLHGVGMMVTAAENELRSRGFTEPTLQLARMLDDPDPAVRRRLVDLLVRTSGVDASNWLWELAEDESPSVREAAVNVLSTSTNPATQQRLGSRPKTRSGR